MTSSIYYHIITNNLPRNCQSIGQLLKNNKQICGELSTFKLSLQKQAEQQKKPISFTNFSLSYISSKEQNSQGKKQSQTVYDNEYE